jgi:PAS domain S-box-containing protein
VHPLVEPVVLDNLRQVIITICALLSFGYLVVRVTAEEQQERAVLVGSRQHIEKERQRLLTLVNSLNTAIFLTDARGTILDSNEAARMLVGANEQLAGKQFGRVATLQSRSKRQDGTIDLLQGTSAPQHRRDLSLALSAGKTIDLDITVTPIRHGGETAPSEYIIACEDITTERSLDEQRTSFISVASHELRTPLAILEAALETLLAPGNKLRSEDQELLQQAYRNATYLADIIKSITMLSEAQNDNLPVQLSHIKSQDMLPGIAGDFTRPAAQKGITIQIEVDPDTPVILSTEQYIREILQNYMTNALKYSKGGEVKLSAEPAANGRVLFSVSDQGIGISPKDQKLLFTKFFRAEDYRTETTGGTGLGLYLCLEIAKRMNAKVWCKSKLNEGSTFYLEVPPFSNLRRDEPEVVQAQVASLVDDL